MENIESMASRVMALPGSVQHQFARYSRVARVGSQVMWVVEVPALAVVARNVNKTLAMEESIVLVTRAMQRCDPISECRPKRASETLEKPINCVRSDNGEGANIPVAGGSITFRES